MRLWVEMGVLPGAGLESAQVTFWENLSPLCTLMWWEAESKASRLVSPENISEQLGVWRVTCLSVATFSHV